MFPTMARVYNPSYAATKPPMPCRRAVVPKTHCCLYYVVDEEERALYFMRLGDTRDNPLAPWNSFDEDK